jgi:K+-sensing histidine kinase KdpD
MMKKNIISMAMGLVAMLMAVPSDTMAAVSMTDAVAFYAPDDDDDRGDKVELTDAEKYALKKPAKRSSGKGQSFKETSARMQARLAARGNFAEALRAAVVSAAKNVYGENQQIINDDYETLSKDEIKMMVGQMMKNTDVITAIITKLIDLSIQQSRHSIEKQDFVSCNNLCREAIRRVNFTHQESVKVDIETSVPDSLLILTDKLIFLKVLRELLYNADQFTQSGSITLGCYQPDEASVCFSVTDTGQGIPEEYRSKLFSKFFKPDEFSEGLGLGLTLCQTAIEQMGGNIRLDETYTTGARFIITLPLR